MAESTSSDGTGRPSRFELGDIVSWGTTSLVVLDKSSNTVIKVPFRYYGGREECRMQSEREAYEKFAQRGAHSGLLSYHGVVGSGIRLEYAPNRDLRSYRGRSGINIWRELRWILQVAEAIEFIHNAGVVHGNLTCENILLDAGLNAKVADFASSSSTNRTDGFPPLAAAATESHRYPNPLPSVQADLSAFGDVIREIITGRPPLREMDGTGIRTLHSTGRFSNTRGLGRLGPIVEKCWRGEYPGAGAAVEALRDFRDMCHTEARALTP